MTTTHDELLRKLAELRAWEREVRTVFAHYKRLGVPIPDDVLQRLIDTTP